MDSQTASLKKSRFSVQEIVMMALFAALLCVSAYISIPLPLPGAPHITLQNFVILLIGMLFPLSESFLTIAVWMILGIIGLPVFIAGGSGIGYLIAGWGGYTVSFLVVALLLPLLRGKKYSRARFTLSAVTAVIVIDLLGMLYLMLMTHLSFGTAVLTGFLPFLPLDLVKAVVAAQIIPAFQKIMKENPA